MLISYAQYIGNTYSTSFFNDLEDVPSSDPLCRYGARALNEGGFQSIPSRLSFPGGCLVGCGAGFMNVTKIKGTHSAMKSGMLAAEAVADAIAEAGDGAKGVEPSDYDSKLRSSYVWSELKLGRNVHPAFARWGLWGGMAYAGLFNVVLRGVEPWTLSHGHADHESTRPAAECKEIEYPKPDGKLTFDLLSSVALTGTNHEGDQPSHLTLKDDDVPVEVNYEKYAGPEGRFCPAGSVVDS